MYKCWYIVNYINNLNFVIEIWFFWLLIFFLFWGIVSYFFLILYKFEKIFKRIFFFVFVKKVGK